MVVAALRQRLLHHAQWLELKRGRETNAPSSCGATRVSRRRGAPVRQQTPGPATRRDIENSRPKYLADRCIAIHTYGTAVCVLAYCLPLEFMQPHSSLLQVGYLQCAVDLRGQPPQLRTLLSGAQTTDSILRELDKPVTTYKIKPKQGHSSHVS